MKVVHINTLDQMLQARVLRQLSVLHDDRLRYVYIGRRGDTHRHFGNPFSHLKAKTLAPVTVPTREEACHEYMAWLNGEHPNVNEKQLQWITDHWDTLEDADVLVCWCAPKACHGHQLVSYLESCERSRQ